MSFGADFQEILAWVNENPNPSDKEYWRFLFGQRVELSAILEILVEQEDRGFDEVVELLDVHAEAFIEIADYYLASLQAEWRALGDEYNDLQDEVEGIIKLNSDGYIDFEELQRLSDNQIRQISDIEMQLENIRSQIDPIRDERQRELDSLSA